VLKCHDFSITQILREINFGYSRSAKSAILTHSEALNVDFNEFLHFLKAEIYQINQIQSPKNCKNGNFRTSRVSKVDFTQNMRDRKILKFFREQKVVLDINYMFSVDFFCCFFFYSVEIIVLPEVLAPSMSGGILTSN